MSDMSNMSDAWALKQQPAQYGPSYEQVAQQEREVKSKQSLADLAKVATDDAWLWNGGKRAIERNLPEYQDDPNFKVSPEQHQSMRMEFGDETAQKIIEEAKSPQQLQDQMDYNREDITRARKISSYGGTGVGVTLAAGILDPVGWAAAVATGPLGEAAKVTQLSRVVRMAALGGIENTAMTGVMYAGDTQAHVDDFFVAAGVGALLGGTIGKFTRDKVTPPRRNADFVPEYEGKPPEPVGDSDLGHVVNGADEFDESAMRAINDASEYDAWLASRANTTPDNFHVVDGIAEHTDNLQRQANLRPTRSQKADLKESIRQQESDLQRLKDEQISVKAAHAAEQGAPRSKAEELNGKVARQVLHRSYQSDIDFATKRLEQLREQQGRYEGVDRAKSDLKKFSAMSQDEKVQHLGLDKPRTWQDFDHVSAVKQSLREMKDEAKPTIADEHPPLDAEGNPVSHAGDKQSIGAARVEGAEELPDHFKLTQDLDDLADNLADEANRSDVLPKRILGKLSSAGAIILSSVNPVARGLGLRLLENAQGGAYHGKTASVLSDLAGNIIRSSQKARYNRALGDYAKRVGGLRGIFSPRIQEEFNELVYTAIARGIPDDTVAEVKMAAEGLADQLKAGLLFRQEAGEAGFETVKSAKDYLPVLFDGVKMNQMVSRYGKDKVTALLSKGYQEGGFKMTKRSSDKVAEVQVMRTMDGTLSGRKSFEAAVSSPEARQKIVDEMREAGVPEGFINQFTEDALSSDIAGSMSHRAMQSLKMNTQTEVEGLRVQDMLKTNVAEVVENYTKEAAAGGAMAKMGFRTRGQVEAAIDMAERAGRNGGQRATDAAAEANILRDSVKLMYGNTLDTDPNSAIVKGTRRLREAASITRLGQMGFAQIPELARAIAHMGIGPVLKGASVLRFFSSKGARDEIGGVSHYRDMREIEELMGYVGEDNWLHPVGTRGEELGEDPDITGKMMRLMDKGLDVAGRANFVLSGFKAIQGGSEKIVTRSILSRLKMHLDGERELSKYHLEEAGLNEETMARLKKHWVDNERWDDHNGQPIRMMNLDKMDPDLRLDLGVAMTRLKGRLIQKHFVGDEGVWMHKWWGKALTQFKGFSIVSIEKQLVHDIRGPMVPAVSTFLWSVFLSYAAYGSQMQMQSIGRADRQKFLDEKFSPQSLAFGVFNKMPQVASFGLAGDGLGTLGLLPDSLMNAPGRTGFNQMGFGSLVPAAGLAGDYGALIKTYADYVKGDPNTSTHQLVDKTRRLVPLANTIGIGQAIKASVDILPEDNN